MKIAEEYLTIIFHTYFIMNKPCLSIFQVHDFGFFRYDPDAIQFLSYEEIPLAPEDACVGLEIRVVGNDSGEKVCGSRFYPSALLYFVN